MNKQNIPFNKILYICLGFIFLITLKNSCSVGRINDTLIENNYKMNKKIDSLQKVNESIILSEFEKQNVILGLKLNVNKELSEKEKLSIESENKSKTIQNLKNELKKKEN